MRTSQKIRKVLRKIHLYVGIFITPALLFFSFTGALQTFNLHESTPGSSYTPPKWLIALGQLHKKQTTASPAKKSRPTAAPGESAQGPSPDSRPGSSGQNPAQSARSVAASTPATSRHLPMKIFFLLVAVGLAISTLTGIYMAFKYDHTLVVIGLLISGIVVPSVLLGF
jgi:hypothetical protein